MKFNVENCDVIMENGFLRLIYHTDKMMLFNGVFVKEVPYGTIC